MNDRSPTRRPPLDLAVPDLESASRFYAAAFDTVVEPVGDEARIVLGRTTLRLCLESASTPSPHYEKGRTPRLELVVDDVGLWTDRMISAGGDQRVRLPGDSGATRYAQVLDPFGHLWAFAPPAPAAAPKS